VAFLRVDTLELFPELRRSLIELLRSLDDGDWVRPTACEGWSVFDVAAHLLGIELCNVSRGRDGLRVNPPSDTEFGAWLDAFHDDWVRSARRLSPQVLIDVLELGGHWFETYISGLDLEADTASIWWIGPGPAPVWLDVAREYSERWVHQQQIRDATSHAGLMDAPFVGPVIVTFVHALPRSLQTVEAPLGTCVDLEVLGAGGGSWHVERQAHGWELASGSSASPAARLTGTVETAWRMYGNYPGMELEATGDRTLAEAVMRGRAVIV
jgi:uncharacterized protein (TIGR03083 family)